MARRKRIVKDGFPWDGKFDSRAAIEKYRSGDKITCLICGQEYNILDTHIRAQHGIDSDAYREKYGIPYMTGLTPTWREERDRKRMYDHFDSNPDDKARRAEIIRAQPYAPLKHKTKPNFWKAERTKAGLDVWYEFGRRVMAGRTTSEVARDDDMPKHAVSSVAWARKRYPDFGKWWKNEVEPVRVIGTRSSLSAENKKAPLPAPPTQKAPAD